MSQSILLLERVGAESARRYSRQGRVNVLSCFGIGHTKTWPLVSLRPSLLPGPGGTETFHLINVNEDMTDPKKCTLRPPTASVDPP
jgi:hypothetical protein